MLFAFTVKYLGFFKQVPLFAQFFDRSMMLWLYALAPERLRLLDELEETVLKWKGTSVSIHRFGGIQFNYNQKEFAHIHSNGILDILFSKKTKADLIAVNQISDHHLFRQSGWTTFYLRKQEDLDLAVGLLELAYLKVAGEAGLV